MFCSIETILRTISDIADFCEDYILAIIAGLPVAICFAVYLIALLWGWVTGRDLSPEDVV